MNRLASAMILVSLTACNSSNSSSAKNVEDSSLIEQLNINSYIWTAESPGIYRQAFARHQECSELVAAQEKGETLTPEEMTSLNLCPKADEFAYGISNSPNIDAFENISLSISGTRLQSAEDIGQALLDCVFFQAANDYTENGLVWLSAQAQKEMAQPLLQDILADSSLEVYRRSISTSDWFINRELYKPCSVLIVQGERKLVLGATISD